MQSFEPLDILGIVSLEQKRQVVRVNNIWDKYVKAFPYQINTKCYILENIYIK